MVEEEEEDGIDNARGEGRRYVQRTIMNTTRAKIVAGGEDDVLP